MIATKTRPPAVPSLPFWSFQFHSVSRGAIKTRRQFDAQLVLNAAENELFHRELVRDPTTVVERILKTPLLPGVRIRVLEENDDTFYLVIPPNPYKGVDPADLPDLIGMDLVEFAGWVCQNHASGAMNEGMAPMVARAWTDDAFRWTLENSPREIAMEGMPVPIPRVMKLCVVFEDETNLYLVLPSRESAVMRTLQSGRWHWPSDSLPC